MNEHEQLAFQKLVKKVDQHEYTIAQLLEIIASINRKIPETMGKKQSDSRSRV